MNDPKPSKSARKRDYLSRQKIGEDLIPLQEEELRSMELDEDLLDAVLEAKHLKKHGALRRQKQYIGKLMGRVDPEPIRMALERLRPKS